MYQRYPCTSERVAQLQLLCRFASPSEGRGRWSGRRASLPTHHQVFSVWKHLQVSLSLSSGVGAMSTALLPWQLTKVGSAPWLSRREQTSTRFLEAASCNGVNCQRSIAFTQAPCYHSKKSLGLVRNYLQQLKLTNVHFIIKIGSNHSCRNTHT